MIKRRLLVVAPLGLTLLAGTACGPNQLGAAAIVGDDRITIAAVQDSVKETRALQDEQSVIVRGPALAARLEVERRVIDLIFLRTAQELGVAATDTEISALIDEQRKGLGGQAKFLQALAANGLNESQVTDVFRTQVLSRKIAEKLAAGQKVAGARAGHAPAAEADLGRGRDADQDQPAVRDLRGRGHRAASPGLHPHPGSMRLLFDD